MIRFHAEVIKRQSNAIFRAKMLYVFQLLGDFVPLTHTGALPLDTTGGLLTSRLLIMDPLASKTRLRPCSQPISWLTAEKLNQCNGLVSVCLSVRPSVCPIFFSNFNIERAPYIQCDSPGGSTRRSQRTFPSEYYEDEHTCFRSETITAKNNNNNSNQKCLNRGRTDHFRDTLPL